MTFYNHIEGVRDIAIDLTNGRKWRGASDKAAVFDALDAARREYMRLSDENAKLRDERERLFQANVKKNGEVLRLVVENAKLRELVRDMNECLEHSKPICKNCKFQGFNCQWFEFDERMRELGVEVDE